MSRRLLSVSGAALALIASLALSSCSSPQASTAQTSSESAPAASPSESESSAAQGSTDATTYANDADACSAAFKDITAIQSDLSSAMTGDPSTAVAALKKVSGQVSSIAQGMQSADNKSALETLATFYSDYANALAAKDTAKVSALQTAVTTEGDPTNLAIGRLGQCVVGK
ncbi:hypothetical protein [Microbacterium sp. SORGH_AS_0888]|uniref:hypothetical protein n=1 Tax=Microbacterium sp. SORGH_AS_0888 TaxID=3041791 RepID=UPI00277DD99E|nr:hypothetical protein [Microbacterium sp. SORGH_AS_0888]MDQ1128557.1 uncharacterized protein YyaL (SSP411 family) [Microbacterium sp. SORGH_AS_0888]